VGSPEKNLIPDAVLEQNRIELLLAEVQAVNPRDRILSTSSGEVTYDRLILATGSLPFIPRILGITLSGVFPIFKDAEHLKALKTCIEKTQDVVVIGGGFIGVEFADEIMKMGGKRVVVVELMPHCLGLSYDDEFCIEAEAKLKERGIRVLTSVEVEAVEGNGKVERVRLSGGETMEANVVILGTGAVANVGLAKEAGLVLGPTGAVWVDRMMRTSENHVFACGDCAEKVSFFGAKPCSLKLASIATHEARVAGANLYEIRRESIGTVGTWSTALGDFALGTAGLTEAAARQHGYQVVVGSAESINRHPAGMPGGKPMKVKLVFDASTGALLGGQVRGSDCAGEVVNIISALVQKRMTANDIASFQMGTHPALTASPIAYHLVNAAEAAYTALPQRKRES
jgi:NADPH-dependent 2,4-dienoyl-CoA reductase/sulfur reductase-like enzyme